MEWARRARRAASSMIRKRRKSVPAPQLATPTAQTGIWYDELTENQRRFVVDHTVDPIRPDIDQAGKPRPRHACLNQRPRVTVVLADGRRDSGTVVGLDPRSDVALVRISPGMATHRLEWGDSDSLRPGHLVLALGSPLGRTFSTSFGVVSALGRTDLQLPVPGAYQDFIQFDAFIDHGSSGGPLLDMEGRVVGINTAIGGSLDAWQGISYAVPEALARRVVEALAENGETRRGWLGVSTAGGEVTASYADSVGLDRPYGVRVRKVTPDSPAEKAGLRRGDIILAVDGYEISSHEQLRSRLAALGPGARVRLRLWRDRATKTVEVRLAEKL